ncbi:hypothetical protein J6590_042659 [Homalodisca vitripennis]|nr:hypothetical protein J6590_042659 [Homalodisca vitripennis]
MSFVTNVSTCSISAAFLNKDTKQVHIELKDVSPAVIIDHSSTPADCGKIYREIEPILKNYWSGNETARYSFYDSLNKTRTHLQFSNFRSIKPPAISASSCYSGSTFAGQRVATN